jgi:hypothetical protein
MIAIATDAAQFPAAAHLAARLVTLNPRDDTDVMLFSDSLADLQAAHSWGGVGSNFGLLESPTQFTGDGRVSGAAFYRLALPRLSGAERLLYLDVDTYPDSAAIFDLFDLDMQGQAVAAVRDLEASCLDTPNQRRELERAGRLRDRRYFNSGMMLVDTARFEAAGVEDRCLLAVARDGLHDQAALNRILDGGWLELSPAFNMTPIGYLSGVDKALKPVLSHFMGKSKPWHGPLFYLDHPARREIEAFIPRSPWPNFLAGNPPADAVRHVPWAPPAQFLAAVAEHLGKTRFADVDQGLTPAPRAEAFGRVAAEEPPGPGG